MLSYWVPDTYFTGWGQRNKLGTNEKQSVYRHVEVEGTNIYSVAYVEKELLESI